MKKLLLTAILTIPTVGMSYAQRIYAPMPEKIVFTTQRTSGMSILLAIDAAEGDRKDVWVDLNGDNTYQAGEEITAFENEVIEYQIGAQTITVYGKLTQLVCAEDEITRLDISHCKGLQRLSCATNFLEELDVSQNVELDLLICETNALKKLDLTKLGKLKELLCYQNKITELLLPKGKSVLDYLDFIGNQVKEIDLSGSPLLREISYQSNGLKNIDFSKNPNLESITCQGNGIQALDISKNPKIRTIYCLNNDIEGERMQSLVEQLPKLGTPPEDAPSWWGQFYVMSIGDEKEHNVCTKTQVAIAKAKGWRVMAWDGPTGAEIDYEGSEDTSTPQILPSGIQLNTAPGKLFITGATSGMSLHVYDIAGQEITGSATTQGNESIDLARGLYVVSIGRSSAKVFVP